MVSFSLMLKAFTPPFILVIVNNAFTINLKKLWFVIVVEMLALGAGCSLSRVIRAKERSFFFPVAYFAIANFVVPAGLIE